MIKYYRELEKIVMQTNKELVKEFYDSFRNKNQDLHNFCQDEVEWITMDGMPNGGRYVGLKSVFEDYFSKMLLNFNEFHAHSSEFLEIGDDRVIVFGLYRGVSKSNKSFMVPFCHVYKLQDNKSYSLDNLLIQQKF